MEGSAAIKHRMETLYRRESRHVLATLIRLLRDFDLAEEALQDAFMAAVEQWPREGLPDNPRAWLVSAGRFKAIDKLRRRARFDASLNELAIHLAGDESGPDPDEELEDDRLRLIFTCCHPTLPPEGRVALTLREICDLTTEQIARAFLTPVPTMAQRIVRAKARIRDAGIPYEVPGGEQLPQRLDSVLQVIYLVFNEGYFASAGDSLMCADLSGEAIRLGRLVLELLPEAEVKGLLALMLLNDSRREARSRNGEPVLLEDQDRRLWDRGMIREGQRLVREALGSRQPGPYSLQAAIAAVHSEAARADDTDWDQIVGLYDLLLRIAPSPVVALNRAVAVAMRDGPEAGLALIEELMAGGRLDRYHLAHAARADLYRRAGHTERARQAYITAIELSAQGPEKAFMARRLRELEGD